MPACIIRQLLSRMLLEDTRRMYVLLHALHCTPPHVHLNACTMARQPSKQLCSVAPIKGSRTTHAHRRTILVCRDENSAARHKAS